MNKSVPNRHNEKQCNKEWAAFELPRSVDFAFLVAFAGLGGSTLVLGIQSDSADMLWGVAGGVVLCRLWLRLWRGLW